MQIPYKNITISGLTCSGATTLATALAQKIAWEQVNPASSSVRSFLKLHNLSLADLGAFPDEDEVMNESMTADVLLNHKNMIVGGRLSGWLAAKMPEVFRIYVTASLEERTRRYARRENISLEEATVAVAKREQAELTKYQRIYNADPTDSALYNLVIDTEVHSREQSLLVATKALGI